jgi:hypothetical protein
MFKALIAPLFNQVQNVNSHQKISYPISISITLLRIYQSSRTGLMTIFCLNTDFISTKSFLNSTLSLIVLKGI